MGFCDVVARNSKDLDMVTPGVPESSWHRGHTWTEGFPLFPLLSCQDGLFPLSDKQNPASAPHTRTRMINIAPKPTTLPRNPKGTLQTPLARCLSYSTFFQDVFPWISFHFCCFRLYATHFSGEKMLEMGWSTPGQAFPALSSVTTCSPHRDIVDLCLVYES